VVPSTQVTHVGVLVQQILPQPNLVTNPIPINQHLRRPQLITPLIIEQPKTVLYPMWYSIVPSFVPMDLSMYFMYYSGIKGFDLLSFGRKNGYVVDVTQPVPHVEQLVENQYPIKVPTSRLKQLVPVAIGVHVQQTMTIVLPINILETGLDYMSMVMVF
jgi:hypothetical protein